VSSLPLGIESVEPVQNCLQFVGRGHQVRDTEVISARFLLEAATGYCHDSSLVNQVHAVQEIRLYTLRLGVVDEFLGKVDAWEAVHRSLDLSTGDVLHVVEGSSKETSLLTKCTVKGLMLSSELSHSLI